MEYKRLNRKGVELSEEQLEQYLEKLASEQILQNYSTKETYPIYHLKENFKFIEAVYLLLNNHVKLGVPIHPAGEWLLDNFYIIEETIEVIIQNMPLKKYRNFLGIANGIDTGFARIYVLAYEIVKYTGGILNYKNISKFLLAYQKKKNLSMDEIWNLGIFMQIAIIQSIADVCEKIYFSQIQKERAQNIFENLVKGVKEYKIINKNENKVKIKEYKSMKYPFIEYLSYRLKSEGKHAIPFLRVLEEQVNRMGMTIDDVVKKEHYDIALKKVSMANYITSMKELLRIDFLSIFEETNEVEEILKKDPVDVYSKMDFKTKEYYRSAVEQISKKTKVAEKYIAEKALELANENIKKDSQINKKSHIGYYLIDRGIEELYSKLQYKKMKKIKEESKVKIYIYSVWIISFLITMLFMCDIQNQIGNIVITILAGTLLIVPIQEIITKIIQYVLSKLVKPKLIPKLDFYKGIPKEESTFVVIPTILKSKEKVQEIMKKLEVYYLANKSENLYFALLGDCSSGSNKEERYDKEVIEEGLKQSEILNNKYKSKIPKFYFTYRKRFWNGNEECYLGWERKRGLLSQFNGYILRKIDNPFLVNTIENNFPKNIKIKNVITLDSDTELVLNTGLKLIGSMAHILNEPILNENKDLVIEGHAIIQPRVGINLEASNKNLFTKIFAGSGGIDSYTNAISDIYQDNFEEGIFTGKGIYNAEIFSKILEKEIPENTVLSHDLLEGSYLRCGLASDIVLMDGYPSSYDSYKNRLHRWIRGDFQIIKWAGNQIINQKLEKKINPLNDLSRYKIIDNLVRAITPITFILTFIYINILKITNNLQIGKYLLLLFISITLPTILEFIGSVVNKKNGQSYQKTFNKRIPGILASVVRSILYICTLPDKACYTADAIVRSMYRIFKSKKHLLEWTTSEDAEKQAKKDIVSYYKKMYPNLLFSVITMFFTLYVRENLIIDFILYTLSITWAVSPFILFFISKEENKKDVKDEISKKDKEYVYEIGKRTWKYFKDSINKENNYLPADNYQEDRKNKFVDRTSSTNIGLGILSVISSYDLGYENLRDTLVLLQKMINTIEKLPKWNGHLYNWYNIKTLEPLYPRYVSTVDNGNYIGYIYVLKEFYKEIKEKVKDREILDLIPNWAEKTIDEVNIAKCNFSELYNEEKGLFSIGYNVEEGKLTDSYYDLLASEARTASFVAISKKDIPTKHWTRLSRIMTKMNLYNGLISWSGTAFEYLMPSAIMDEPEGSILNESIRFMLMSQKQYARKLSIPWGFSESAYNLKDLNGNYQYKAIGLPWLGLKRGLEEDIVVSSYASIMAITKEPKEVIQNIKKLDNAGMYDKYGLYESIDYTPIRMPRGKKEMIVKTYMAHHQGLILLSINNFFNNNILQKRFLENPEISALQILLQETMPEKKIVTNEEKKKPQKITYKDYENYAQRVYTKTDTELPIVNVISSDSYSIVTDTKGLGYSKYKEYYINKYDQTSDEKQGILFFAKNVKGKRMWTLNDIQHLSKADKYEISFSEDKNKIRRMDGQIESICSNTVIPQNPVEIRELKLINHGIEEEMFEITVEIEPMLESAEEYFSHPAFQNLFLIYEYDKENDIFLIKRKDRTTNKKDIYMAVSFFSKKDSNKEIEFEIDKEKFQGRGNLGFPIMVENSIPFSNKIKLTVNPTLALRKTVLLKPEEEVEFNLLISVSENKNEVINNIKEFKNEEKIRTTFELAKAKADAEARYLNLNAKQIENYQKILGYILMPNGLQNKNKYTRKYYSKEELWENGISGDLPILTVKIKDSSEINVLVDVLKAFEFFRLKNIDIDLVIINKEPNSYEKYTKEAIQNAILNANMGYLQNIKGGIFVFENEDTEIIEFYSKLIIDSDKGPLNRQLNDMEEEYIENKKNIGEKVLNKIEVYEEKKTEDVSIENKELLYFNEYGGFSKDGREYLIQINRENRLPTVWSHIMANKKFGTIVTDSFGGYTWSNNSRLNKITNWSNNQVIDEPSEVIYIQDINNLKECSCIGINPMPNDNKYKVIYGFGYAKYENKNNGIKQELTTFVPCEDSLKISVLTLKNELPGKRKLNLYYYSNLVLGETTIKNNLNINIDFEENNNILLLNNKTNTDFKDITYFTCSEKIRSYTGNKDFFIGNSNLSNPFGIKKVSLDSEKNDGNNKILAYQIEVELEAFETKEIVFVLGTEENKIYAQDKAYQYTKIQKAEEELLKVKSNWENFLGKIQVTTPVESFNILMNGWLIYQTYVSRLNARTSFYQCGGAFGFRDQLQDTIALKYFSKDVMKEQIIKHSKHQFIEGDVEHWWHEETKRGIRTRFSDDLLWLVYLVEEYINYTNDYSILDEITPYLDGEELLDGVDEKYDRYEQSYIEGSIYEHCKKALERGLKFGKNGLCKIGSGDWNDGMSNVGNKGEGESVWLSFFVYDILKKWIPICEQKNENKDEIDKYKEILEKLRKNLNNVAWDGRWYRRAFTDDGKILRNNTK